MKDWLWMSMGDLGRGIAAGEIDPLALTETYLDAINTHELRDRIYARTTDDRALAEAEAASKRAKSGHRRGLLDGVPVSWKDLFDTAGVATEAGSALLEGRVPDADAPVLKNATLAGTVCLGKTHMSELAFSGLGLNPITATPPCVNDAGAVSGGSSSGAAASVAFGLAPCGIGSDTGGSVRIPSAWNDLVGLKTTSGRLTLKGVVPLCARFDTIGPLCRNVEDAALMLGALEGTAAVDLRGASTKGLRIGLLQAPALDDVRDAPMAAYDEAVTRLADAGVTIEKFDAPEVETAMSQSGVTFTAEAYGTWKDTIEAAPEKMFDQILERFRAGAQHSGPDFVRAWQMLDECREVWNARVAGYDAVLIPSAPILPPNVERLLSDHNYYVTENLLALRNTRIGNMLGLSAITLPVSGHPSCGVIAMGKAYGEEALLRVAAAMEPALKPSLS
ncbi:amidase family protein [Alisedimentitalea sp. MJ-SS2]|uniref:amidase n=1 Tax=Aliisedimentitalea sp. MJ-SS2 TaxID=3049795 RepID=UPI00290BD998|nr:amidase family protein [Alisedimentitalea sp. MJ-SS2]MDU8929262.1 amidase family protein [Alisedimentitalea sp. MJ-SS2]